MPGPWAGLGLELLLGTDQHEATCDEPYELIRWRSVSCLLQVPEIGCEILCYVSLADLPNRLAIRYIRQFLHFLWANRIATLGSELHGILALDRLAAKGRDLESAPYGRIVPSSNRCVAILRAPI